MKELSRRHIQVGEKIKRTLAGLFSQGRFDRITTDIISILEVRPSRGYENAVVFVRAFDTDKTDSVVEALNAAAGEIRYELAHTADMRSTPELLFRRDEAEDTAARIDALLREGL